MGSTKNLRDQLRRMWRHMERITSVPGETWPLDAALNVNVGRAVSSTEQDLTGQQTD